MNPATEIADRLCVGKTERQQHLLRAVQDMIAEAYISSLASWMQRPDASTSEFGEAFWDGVKAAMLLHDFVRSMDDETIRAEIARMEGGA